MSRLKSALCLVCSAALLLCSAGCGNAAVTAKENTTITVWIYYNGNQLDSFNSMVEEFNNTTGREKGITVESYSQGSISDLETNVMASAEGKVGASAMPNIFSAYADTAYALDQMGMVVDLSGYLTDEEKAAYVPGYLDEGDFSGNGSLKIFPTAKSTELLFLNETDWHSFAEATGADYSDLKTVEGVVQTAEAYYNWTDSLTPEEGDGKAFFGRDAMANYILIGARQLGCTVFDVQDGKVTLNFDKEIVRKLWDNYYVPFVKGYFSASGSFRSDDIKTGNIVAYVGSSSSAGFFPDQVVTGDTESHSITRTVLPCPVFEEGQDVVVQQGAGMVVTTASDAEIEASVEFLKWFTDPKHNIAFSVGSDYLPVTTAGSDLSTIKKSGLEITADTEQLLTAAFEAVQTKTLYTPKPFAGGYDARNVLEYAMNDQAEEDRSTVVERMAQGQSFEEAAEEFLSDDNFEQWYQQTLISLQEKIGSFPVSG